MKGIIYKAIKWGVDKGKNATVIQRYLKIKHKIIITKDCLLRRVKRYKQSLIK